MDNNNNKPLHFRLKPDACVALQGSASLGHNAHLYITYSAGLQALQLAKYTTALRCFQVRPCLSAFDHAACPYAACLGFA